MRTRRGTAPVHSEVPSALLYLRVSSDDQAREGTSLDAQLSECRRYVLKHEWAIDGEFTDVMSGTRDDRPQYQALLGRVRQLRGDKVAVVVVVAALDRFGRRMLERVRCREELKTLGVTTHSVREGGEVSDLVANILASVAQEEVARLGMRIRSTWAHLGAQGWRKIGGNGVAWGYRSRVATDEERKAGSPRTVVEPDPLAAPYARELFERIAAGETTRSVTRWAAGLPGEARGGRALTRRTVQDMLVAPGYAGLITIDGPRGQWEPIVDAVTFRRVQERMEGQQRMPRQASGRYLLTSLLRCPLCDGRMRGELIPNGRRYRCGGETNTGRCSQTADAEAVEHLALTEIGQTVDAMVNDPRVQAGLRKAWQARQTADGDDHSRKIHQLESTIERSRKRVTRATELFVDGNVDKPAYDALVAKAREEIAAADAELADLQPSLTKAQNALPPLESVVVAAGSWATVLEGADIDAQREVLAVLVDRIVPIRERPGVYRVEITWTPLGEALRAWAI
jgi:site-specific DNA recombinase